MWRLGKYLSSLTKSELEDLKGELNLTETEEQIFDLLAKGKSNTCVSESSCIAISTVANKVKGIKFKIIKAKGEIF